MVRVWVLIALVWVLSGATMSVALDAVGTAEFAALSRQTQRAMVLSATELGVLVERCDHLLEQTAGLSATEKKVMVRKLQRLRGLFLYVLESKQTTEDRPGN